MWRRYTWAYQGVRNVHFSENLACFVFLKHSFWDSPFCLIIDDITLYLAKFRSSNYISHGKSQSQDAYERTFLTPWYAQNAKKQKQEKDKFWTELVSLISTSNIGSKSMPKTLWQKQPSIGVLRKSCKNMQQI